MHFTLQPQGSAWCLCQANKPLRTQSGQALVAQRKDFAESVLQQLQARPPRMFLFGFWQAVVSAGESEQNHMREVLRQGLAHDQLLYPANTPQVLAERQRQAWSGVLAWLAGLGVELAGPSLEAEWQGAEHLETQLNSLTLPELVWVYGMGRLLHSPAMALWALKQLVDGPQLMAMAYAEEQFQQQRYRPDTQAQGRLDAVQADVGDLLAIKNWVLGQATL